MIIKCNHGYYKFYEETPEEIAKFNTFYGQDLTAKDDYYTFAALKDLEKYSIKGALYGALTALESFEGEIWEVMRKNGFVYDFLNKVLSFKSITGGYFKARQLYGFNVHTGLLLPGSFSDDNIKITGYHCKVSLSNLIFNYTEFFYE
jgi:hypothetical protein